jgi:hypothetical protein
MTQNPIILNNRSIISISGENIKVFLQGLITNDINKASDKKAIYAFMLGPQGRFLYDFFIIKNGEKFLLDCNKKLVDEIIQKFSFYKLRSKIEIKKEDLLVITEKYSNQDYIDELIKNSDVIVFNDPRNNKMGYRIFAKKNVIEKFIKTDKTDNAQYNFDRISLKIPDDSDLTMDRSFPLEFGFDDLHSIDYKKGCYVGQETTARMHYKGIIRKKIFLVEVTDCNEIEKSSIIEAKSKKIGEILSSIFYNNKLLALALIKNLDNEGNDINLLELVITASGKKIKLID